MLMHTAPVSTMSSGLSCVATQLNPHRFLRHHSLQFHQFLQLHQFHHGHRVQARFVPSAGVGGASRVARKPRERPARLGQARPLLLLLRGLGVPGNTCQEEFRGGGEFFRAHWEKVRSIEEGAEEVRCASLAEWGAAVLRTADPVAKAVLTHRAYRLWCGGEIALGAADAPDSPARPAKPELVHPWKIPPPSGTILTPSAHALHNLAHIELNAIDLAWDTVVRFSAASDELSRQFFGDFAHVADDESRHFLWCLQRLAEMGFSYGDMPAHNLLLADCEKTSGDVMARLAIIPMMQEARGLDAGPRLFDRLMGNGDTRSAGITKRIAEEEVGHVAVGVVWFVDVCRRLGLDPANCFQGLLKESDLELRGPFNHSARLLAGLPRDWYDASYDPSSDTSEAGERQRETESRGKKINSRLPEVFDRLAVVVAMEQENADS